MMRNDTRHSTVWVIALLIGLIAPAIVGAQVAATNLMPGLNRTPNLDEHLFILNLSEAAPPGLVPGTDYVVFTYRDDQRLRPRHVSLVFAHEDFGRIHTLHVNSNGVFFYFLPLPRELQERNEPLRYRMIVDGVWMSDPINPRTELLRSGVRLSTVALPPAPPTPPASPVIGPLPVNSRIREVRFVYQGQVGQDVRLAGSFNGWDPFMFPMVTSPAQPNVFEFTVRVLPGDYRYVFFVDGRRVTDPLNPRTAFDADRGSASAFQVR